MLEIQQVLSGSISRKEDKGEMGCVGVGTAQVACWQIRDSNMTLAKIFKGMF